MSRRRRKRSPRSGGSAHARTATPAGPARRQQAPLAREVATVAGHSIPRGPALALAAAGSLGVATLVPVLSLDQLSALETGPAVRLAAAVVAAALFVAQVRAFGIARAASGARAASMLTHELPRGDARGRRGTRALPGTRPADVAAAALVALQLLVIGAATGLPGIVAWLAPVVGSTLARVGVPAHGTLADHAIAHAAVRMVPTALLVPALGTVGAIVLADGHATQAALAAVSGTLVWLVYAAALLLLIGIELSARIERYYAASGTRAFYVWMSCPSAGAIALTYVAREQLDTGTMLTCALVAFGTIFMHGRTLGRRPLPDPPRSAAGSLDRSLRTRLELLPMLSATALATTLAVAGLSRLLQ